MVASAASVVGEPLTNWRFAPAAGENAFQHELIVLAGLEAVLFKKDFSGAYNRRNVEHRFHRATIAAAANERAIRPFAEHQIQRANHNGFARAGFARDGLAPRLQFQRQVRHEGEIFDAQRG